MRKILFLLFAFVTITMQAQTANGSESQFEAVQITNPQTVTSVNFLTSMGTDGTMGKITPANLPVSTATQTALDLKLSKTGEGFNYAIDFDDVLSQNSGLTIGKRTLKPESSRLPDSYRNIIAWGDSFTQGAGSSGGLTYPADLSTLTGFSVTNKGIGGETSTEIKDRFIADTGNYDKSVIIWAGRNNVTDPTTVKADIATMISTLTHSRYLVVSILNSSSEVINSANWVTITTLNNDLKALYGKKYVPLRDYLVSLNDGTTQGNLDFTNDIVPYYLRYDTLHLNNLGYQLTADFLNQRLGILYGFEGYLQSKDINYYISKNISGTANTFSKFTSASTIGNSSWKESASGGRMYNNTDDGSNALQVNGNSSFLGNISSSGAISGTTGTFSGAISTSSTISSTGTNPQLNLGTTAKAGRITVSRASDGSPNGSFGYPTNSDSSEIRISSGGGGSTLTFYTAGSERGRFSANGNLLIGNTTDGSIKLDVNGTARISGQATLTVSPIISSETANTIASFDANKNLKSLPLTTYPSPTELSYSKDVTSPIQPQIDSKEPTITAGTTAKYWRGDKTWQDLNSEISIQKIVDNTNRYGELDGGNSYIYTLFGSANNRIFKAKTGDATNSCEIYSSNNEVLLRGEISGVSTGVFQVFNGLSKIIQTSTSGTTTIGVIPATVNATINNPANSVAGTYIYQMQPKEYTVSTLPTPTGSDSRFAIVTDALAPAYLSILIGGGSVVTPAFYNGTNWVSH